MTIEDKVKFKSNSTHPLAAAVNGEFGKIVSHSQTDGVSYYNIMFPVYGLEASGIVESELEIVD